MFDTWCAWDLCIFGVGVAKQCCRYVKMVLSAMKCGLFHLDNILYFSCTFDFTLLIQANAWQIGTFYNVFKVYNGVCSISERKTCYRHSQSHSVKLLIKLVECIWNGFCLAFTMLMRVHNLLTRKMHNENETNTNIKQRLNATYIILVLHIFRKCLCTCDLSLVCVSSI